MDNNLVTEAINLTLFGMGFVFVFLALMVVVTTMMSVLVKRFQPNLNLAATQTLNCRVELMKRQKQLLKKQSICIQRPKESSMILFQAVMNFITDV